MGLACRGRMAVMAIPKAAALAEGEIKILSGGSPGITPPPCSSLSSKRRCGTCILALEHVITVPLLLLYFYQTQGKGIPLFINEPSKYYCLCCLSIPPSRYLRTTYLIADSTYVLEHGVHEVCIAYSF